MNPWDTILKGVIGVFDEVYYSDEEKARDQYQRDLEREKQKLDYELRSQQAEFQKNLYIGVGVVALAGIITWGVVAAKKAA